MIEIPGVGMVKVSAIQTIGLVYSESLCSEYKVMIGGHGFDVQEEEMSREELIRKIEEYDA